MDVVTISFSQNKKVINDNSSQIANGIKELSNSSVKHLKVNDYKVTPCLLCGDCANTQTCLYDQSFNRFIKDIGHPSLIYLVVPYYSPLPSTLMIILEKLNQIFYSSWIMKNENQHALIKTSVGLIVHGGMVDSKETKNHYKTMVNKPLSFTLKNLQFKVIEDESDFQNGLAFGLENQDNIYMVENQLFPNVDHNSNYIKKTLKEYVKLASSS